MTTPRRKATIVSVPSDGAELTGWSLPLTRSGQSALVAPPPWHYSGEIICVDYTVDPDHAASFLPPEVKPDASGAASFVAADWSSASDADPRVAADPARGQHREVYLAVYGRFQGRTIARVAAIWVDNDLSLVRGLIQGFPKKLGMIAMTRPVELGRGGSRKVAGSRFSAHVSALGQRLAQATVVLDAEEPGARPRGVSTPLLHTRHWPAIDDDRPAVHELTRGMITDFQLGKVFTGSAELRLFPSDYDELELLMPRAVGRGAVFSLAFSVLGGTKVTAGDVRASVVAGQPEPAGSSSEHVATPASGSH